MRLTPNEELVLDALRRHRLSMSEIEDKFYSSFRPSRRTLQRILTELVRQGHVVQTGNGRGTRYEKHSE